MSWEILKSPLVLVFGWLTITSVVSTIAAAWFRARRVEVDAALKQTMIERGYTASDIVRVLQASSRGKKAEEVQEDGQAVPAKI